MKKFNILIACEESQRVCKEFRKLGFNAYSCDLLPTSRDKGGYLETGEKITIDGKWDLMVAHPPCTFLSVSGAKWYYHPDDKHLPTSERRPHPNFPNRAQDREEAADFFMKLAETDIERIAVNPSRTSIPSKFLSFSFKMLFFLAKSLIAFVNADLNAAS